MKPYNDVKQALDRELTQISPEVAKELRQSRERALNGKRTSAKWVWAGAMALGSCAAVFFVTSNSLPIVESSKHFGSVSVAINSTAMLDAELDAETLEDLPMIAALGDTE